MPQVALLDSLALGAVDSVREAHTQQLKALAASRTATLDSLAESASDMGGSIAHSQRLYRDAQSAYRRAFLKTRRYRSFGGNPVFSEDDIGVGAQKLLDDIANRFYKGRAFSLETESALRNYIRQTLIPLEKRVVQARANVNRLRRAQSGRNRAVEVASAEFQKKREVLFSETNQAILQMLAERELARAAVDSSGWYSFKGLAPGDFFVYAPYPLPEGFLVEVTLKGHTRQDLGRQNIQQLMLVDETADASKAERMF